jgi:mono/diheme cytochrome c family protein
VTEVPEHLLKRSRERRAAIGGGDAGTDAPPSATAEAPAAEAAETAVEPVAAAAAPAAPAPPEPPKPVPGYIQAAQRRRRIPYWAMPVLAALPLWAYMYQGTLEPPPADESDPMVLGEELYGGCSTCHGGGGQGASGPALTEVLATWPDFRDHMMWVRLGSDGWPADTYGADGKPKNGGMPPHPRLSDEDLARVVLYERTQFGKEDPAEQVDLLAVANGEKTFAEVGLGSESEAAGVEPPAGE